VPTTKTKAPSTLDNVAKIVKDAGEDGIAVKNIATNAGVSVDVARKAVKQLTDDGKVRKDGTTVFPVSRVGRRSAEVVDRDDKILTVIKNAGKDGITLKDAAIAVSTTERLTYESVWRLREQGLVQREGSTRNARWVAA
jgi:transposase